MITSPRTTSHGTARTFQALILILFLAITAYALARTIFIAYAHYQPLEKLLSILFLGAELFVMVHAVGYFLLLFRVKTSGTQESAPPSGPDFPPVAILIPARHEPKPVLESTLISCYNIPYPNKTIYLLDDSSEPRYQQEAQELAHKYAANLFRRADRHGAKAGVINDCVKTISAPYIAVFDVDQNPMPTFLSELIGLMEQNPRLAIAQCPQFYSNVNTSKVAFAAQMQQAVFYEYICEGKNEDQSMICCGTNVLIRREALMSVGGLDESSVTEDFATSFRLHLKGWQTVYCPHVNTFGMGPEDLGAYFKQQGRWARGNVGILRHIIRSWIKNPGALTARQWFDYFITSSYYLISCAYLFLILCPIFYIFFNMPSFFMNPAVYTLTFFPYLLLSLMIFYSTMAHRRYTPMQMLAGQALAFLTQPVFLKASINAILGRKATFDVTAKDGAKTVPYRSLGGQLFLWGLNLSALTWGLNRLVYEPTAAIGINLVWIFYHICLFSTVFYFNET